MEPATEFILRDIQISPETSQLEEEVMVNMTWMCPRELEAASWKIYVTSI